MPTFKTSAMDPSGTWQSDAMDQVEQWNANRGDQWSRYAMSLANQNREDDWRKQVALQQLGLQRDMWQGGREDTAAERAAKYGFAEKELGLRTKESEADRALRERGFGLQEQGLQMQLDERRRLADERAADAEALNAFDLGSLGYDEPTAQAIRSLPRSMVQNIIAQRTAQQIARQGVPEERKQRGEEIRGMQSLAAMSALEGKGELTPREMQQYAMSKAEAEKQGYGGTGGISPQQIKAQEFVQDEMDALLKRADDIAGGLFGYASSDDIAEIKARQTKLAATMSKAGYPAEDVRNVMRQINAKLNEINANDFVNIVR